MAFLTPPSGLLLSAKMTAQQEQEDTERGDADDPKIWIFYGKHSQYIRCAKSCTFKPDGKISSIAIVQSLCAQPPACSAQQAESESRRCKPQAADLAP